VDVVQQHSAWAEPEHGRSIKTLDGEHERAGCRRCVPFGFEGGFVAVATGEFDLDGAVIEQFSGAVA
jgi:hypothetical protein